MSAILKYLISKKKKTITFFWSKLSKLHEKDPILHVTTTFPLKQEETRTNSVPIPHPLNCLYYMYIMLFISCTYPLKLFEPSKVPLLISW